jgi:polyisoprenoid-binding protein YceI
MKTSSAILLALLTAVVASLLTYLAVSNHQLRQQLAREAASAPAQPPAARASAPSNALAPPPWRPTRLVREGTPTPAAPVDAPDTASAEEAFAKAPASAPAQATPDRVVLLPAPLIAGSPRDWLRYHPLPGGKVRLTGTSSLHPWEINGTVIGGSLELPPGKAPPTNLAARVRIPVRTLKSDQKQMDEVMQATLEAGQYPNIEYELQSFGLMWPTGSNLWQCVASGRLTVHGVALTNSMPVAIERLDKGKRLRVSGQTPLRMTDFGMAPVDVNLAIGRITTGDEVTVEFEWLLERRE